MPGDNVIIQVELITPLAMDKGLGFIMREEGRTVGAGVVSRTLDESRNAIDADPMDEIGGGSVVIRAAKPALSDSLFQNVPNPFNPSTLIAYQLPEAGRVSLVVYSLLGQPVRALVQDHQEAGYYKVTWDGKDAYGRPVSSGVYLYRFVSKGQVETKRMLLLK